MGTVTGVERRTTVVRLAAGLVEYRLEERGDATVVVFHGGNQRAGPALGEEIFADAGYTVLAPSRPAYGRTPVSTGTSVTGFADVTRTLCAHLGITRLAAVLGTSGEDRPRWPWPRTRYRRPGRHGSRGRGGSGLAGVSGARS
jgi:pimeloyl-ACP methyl ester carboxylesterase